MSFTCLATFVLATALTGQNAPNDHEHVFRAAAGAPALGRVAGPAFAGLDGSGRFARPSRQPLPFPLPGGFERPDATPLATDLVIGDDTPDETVTIQGPFAFEGRIIILNQGRLRFLGADASIRGSIIALHDGSVTVQGGTVRFLSSHLYQYSSAFFDRSVLAVKDAVFEYQGGTYGIYLDGRSILSLNGVTSNGRVTVALAGRSRVMGRDVAGAGEYVILGENRVQFTSAGQIILWLHFASGTRADLALPDGAVVPWFRYPRLPKQPQDPAFDVELWNCRDVLFTVMTAPGSDLTLRDSTVRAAGVIVEDQGFLLDGLFHGQRHAHLELPLADRRFVLENTELMTLNAYPMPGSAGRIEQSLLGEILVQGSAAEIVNTQIDGTGGYFAASGGGTAVLVQANVLSPILVRESSVAILAACGVPAGEIRADGGSVMAAIGTPLRVRPRVTDTGLVAVAWLDAPVDPRAGEVIPLSGTAVMDGGPAFPMDLYTYDLSWSADAAPGTFHHIATFANEVWAGPLGQWPTQGLGPGIYFLKLVLRDTFGNEVETLEAVELEP